MLQLKLIGAAAAISPAGLDELPSKSNYFIGRDPSRWEAGVRSYARVSYHDIYPGVDLVYYGDQGRLEYDFIIAPGTDLESIGWSVEGAPELEFSPFREGEPYEVNSSPALRVDSEGNLLARVADGTVRLNKPVVYEFRAGERRARASRGGTGRRFLDGRYVLKGNGQFGFAVAGRDLGQTLVIDPVLDYSTYLGGSMDDQGASIAVDSSGNAYITGQTLSTNFPVMAPTQSSCKSCSNSTPTPDAFVTKFNPTGSALIYSTFLGGSANDIGFGIAVDSFGDAYVTGETLSTDFPVMNAAQPTCASCSTITPAPDAFVTKLGPTGVLVYSTYLGGTNSDQGFAIAADSAGYAYVTGSTSSVDFPTRGPLPAPNNALQGTVDAFVSKFDLSGALMYSTYLGGSGQDEGFGIALDSSGSAYVAGQTNSNNFPTVSPLQGTFKGLTDAFVAKFSPGGSTLVYSTYLGGTNNDSAAAIAVDSSGSAYVTGSTSSTDFPTTPGAFQAAFAGGTSDAFVTKLNAAGSTLVYSTYLGGSGQDAGNGIAVDTSGNANVVGVTASTNFPNANPIQTGYNGNQDAFMTRLVPAGCAPAFSTYLGGHSTDIGTGVAVDSSENAYVTGRTSSNDFPLQTPFQAMTGGLLDAFVARMNSFSAAGVCLSTTTVKFAGQVLTTTSSAQTITLTNGGNASLGITNIAASGDFAQTDTCGTSVAMGANCAINVTFSPMAAGARGGTIAINDDAGGSPQSIALTGTGTDFGISVLPSTATATAGQSAIYTLTVTPISGFNSTVNLTCSGTPPAGGCAVSPNSLTLNGSTAATAKLTITTAKSGAAPFRGPKMLLRRPGVWGSLFFLLAFTVLTMLFELLGRRRKLGVAASLHLAASLSVMLAVVLWPACGFNGSPSGTPRGTYNLQITGTDGTLQRSVRVSLTVN